MIDINKIKSVIKKNKIETVLVAAILWIVCFYIYIQIENGINEEKCKKILTNYAEKTFNGMDVKSADFEFSHSIPEVTYGKINFTYNNQYIVIAVSMYDETSDIDRDITTVQSIDQRFAIQINGKWTNGYEYIESKKSEIKRNKLSEECKKALKNYVKNELKLDYKNEEFDIESDDKTSLGTMIFKTEKLGRVKLTIYINENREIDDVSININEEWISKGWYDAIYKNR